MHSDPSDEVESLNRQPDVMSSQWLFKVEERRYVVDRRIYEAENQGFCYGSVALSFSQELDA
jgi:hypothetical protein